MRTLRRFFKRLVSSPASQEDEDRLKEEIEEHLALQTAENIRGGLTPAEARRQAALKFGGVESMKELYRDQRGIAFIETLLQDIRYGLRRLRKTPAFTLTVILTLALGIGATTAIFTLVHAVLLKSLPVTKPEELARIGNEENCCVNGGLQDNWTLFSYEQYRHFKESTQEFQDLVAVQAGGSLVGVRRGGSDKASEPFRAEFVSGNYFSTFGIPAYTG